MAVGLRHLIMSFVMVGFVGVQPAQAVNLCNLFFWKKTNKQNVEGRINAPPVEKARETLIEQLKNDSKIPSFLKQTRSGDVPVILLNANTYQQLKPVLDNSMGTMIVQQLGYKNDHGLMRVGQNIIDVDTPGARGFGEINRTGLSWKPMESYLKRRLKNESNNYYIVEVGYILSPQELADSRFYHLVRRAAIIRVPFTYGGLNVDRNQSNMLSAGEHCFVFCKGGAVSSHVREIERKLKAYGIESVSEFMKRPEVAVFVREARDYMLTLKNFDEQSLNWAVLQKLRSAKIIRKKFSNFDEHRQDLLLNWIVGYDASLAYENLRVSLGMTSDYGFGDMNNTRAAFVLVYGKSTDNKAFETATFESPGVMYSWRNDSQKPIK